MHLILKNIIIDSVSQIGFVMNGAGWLWGEGKPTFLSINQDHLVLETKQYEISPFGNDNRVNFHDGTIVFRGKLHEAAQYIIDNGGKGKVVIGACLTDLKASVLVSGNYGKCEVGSGIACVGDWGTAISGASGKSIAGRNGTAISRYEGHAKSGINGTSRTGIRGTAIVDINGKASARDGGLIIFRTSKGPISFQIGKDLHSQVLYQLNFNDKPIPSIESLQEFGIMKFLDEKFDFLTDISQSREHIAFLRKNVYNFDNNIRDIILNYLATINW